jgi:hypothetical protein
MACHRNINRESSREFQHCKLRIMQLHYDRQLHQDLMEIERLKRTEETLQQWLRKGNKWRAEELEKNPEFKVSTRQPIVSSSDSTLAFTPINTVMCAPGNTPDTATNRLLKSRPGHTPDYKGGRYLGMEGASTISNSNLERTVGDVKMNHKKSIKEPNREVNINTTKDGDPVPECIFNDDPALLCIEAKHHCPETCTVAISASAKATVSENIQPDGTNNDSRAKDRGGSELFAVKNNIDPHTAQQLPAATIVVSPTNAPAEISKSYFPPRKNFCFCGGVGNGGADNANEIDMEVTTNVSAEHREKGTM